jgi:hypothetical protein
MITQCNGMLTNQMPYLVNNSIYLKHPSFFFGFVWYNLLWWVFSITESTSKKNSNVFWRAPYIYIYM